MYDRSHCPQMMQRLKKIKHITVQFKSKTEKDKAYNSTVLKRIRAFGSNRQVKCKDDSKHEIANCGLQDGAYDSSQGSFTIYPYTCCTTQ